MTKQIVNPVQRNVHLRYKPEEIGSKTIERVCRYYMNGNMLSDILQVINGPRAFNVTLNLADLYTILNLAAQAKKIKQRKKYGSFELRINDFVTVFRAWKSGMKPREILSIVPTCKVGVDRVLRALNVRHREEKARLQIAAEASALDILSRAHTMAIDGRAAFVIFQDEIPQEAIKAGVALPELDEDILFETAQQIPEDEEVSSGKKSTKQAYSEINTEEKLEDQHCSLPIVEDTDVVPKVVKEWKQPPPRHPIPIPAYSELQEVQSEEEMLSDPVYNIADDKESSDGPSEINERESVKQKISDLLD